MPPILTLIPLETWISILVLVVSPAFIVAFLRFSLHKKLEELNSRISRLLVSGQEEGLQPEIVKRLRNRYQKASQKLEHVNTLALIDSIYKDERVRFLVFKIQFDRADGITRVLPNLLIAFGLVGTFLGITNNLTNISTIVTSFSDSNGNIGGLVQGLQKPLQDMGIAFSASLFGILFGSMLTIVNTVWNTSIAKYQLFSGLEDYLDNIYKPTVEGNTRLDTAIDRMVKQQQEFLTRFHENVGAALERSFGKAANQIAEECGRINQIAENVYTNFSNAAGTISTGATTFQQAAISLEGQTQIVMELMPQLKGGVDTFVSAANKVKTNNIIKHLNTLVENLSVTQSAFTSSTQTLAAGVEGIMSSHQQSTQTAEKVYQGLEKTTASIQLGANNFVSAAQIIRDSSLAADLTIAANKWQTAQNEFTKSTTIFSQAAINLQPVASKLEPAITSIDQAVNSLQQVSSEVVTLSKNNVQISEFTQTTLTGFNRNCLKVLNNTDLSIQDISTTNKSNWQSLVNILEPKIQTDRESLQRLLAVIEKLEKIVSNIDNTNNRGRSSGLQGLSQSN